MAFIEITDLYTAIRAEQLTQITRGDNTVIDYAVDAAVAEMSSYLSKAYNTSLIFSQTGDSRNKLLLNFGIDITIYIIVSTALPGQDLEDRRARYKRALDWLRAVADGEIMSNLPMLPPIDDNVNVRGTVGAHTKRINYF